MEKELTVKAIRKTGRRGNPNWGKGMPNGLDARIRKAQQSSTSVIRNGIERFLRSKMNMKSLNKFYQNLDERDQLTLLLNLLPFVIAKHSNASELERLSEDELNALYDKTIKAIQSSQAKILEPFRNEKETKTEVAAVG